MNRDIIKKAKQFVKSVNYDVDINTVIKAIQAEGYTFLFYDPEETHSIIEWLNVVEYSKKDIGAFTCLSKKGKYMFVKEKLPVENQLLSALHELGHIMLNHIGKRIRHERLEEAEADAFTYFVLYYSGSCYPQFIKSIMSKIYKLVKRRNKLI